jgi:hypothetical protein
VHVHAERKEPHHEVVMVAENRWFHSSTIQRLIDRLQPAARKYQVYMSVYLNRKNAKVVI